MQFKIETGIEVPKHHETLDFPLSDMKSGQSFRIGKELVSRARYAVKEYMKKVDNVEFKVTTDNQNLQEGETKGDYFRVHCINQ